MKKDHLFNATKMGRPTVKPVWNDPSGKTILSEIIPVGENCLLGYHWISCNLDLSGKTTCLERPLLLKPRVDVPDRFYCISIGCYFLDVYISGSVYGVLVLLEGWSLFRGLSSQVAAHSCQT